MASDDSLINKIKTVSNEDLDTFSMKPIKDKSLIIQNGTMYIIGGVSSGKSTLISKLIKIYDSSSIRPIILCLYSNLPDETTQFNVSSYAGNMHMKPFFIRLANDECCKHERSESFVMFFNQLRSSRLKYSELLLFLKSVLGVHLNHILPTAYELFNGIEKSRSDYNKRMKMLKSVITESIDISKSKTFQHVYWIEYVMKVYSVKRKIDFTDDPITFIATCCVSLSDALNELEIMISNPALVKGYELVKLPPQIRLNSNNNNKGYELIPTISILDDVAQFHLLTTERSSQWVKDLFAETRRFKNTFIVAAQRYNLLNKTLRSLTHTFFIGYSLVDADIPVLSKEMPSNLVKANEFEEIYHKLIKPFTFIVYNNKIGIELIKLQK